MRENNKIKRANQDIVAYPTYEMSPASNEAPTRLRHYLDAIIKRRWLILTVMAACILIAFINALTETPLYKAVATIQMNLDKAKILPYQEIRDTSPYAASEKYLQTQCSVLQSRSLAQRIIRKLNLDTNPDFLNVKGNALWGRPKAKNASTSAPSPVGKSEGSTSGSDAAYSAYAERLLKNLEVIPSIQRSQIIQINYSSPNPRLAADIANTLTKEYIQLNLENQYEATQQAMEFLSKQITEMRTKVTQADEALLQYARTYDLPPPSEKEKTPAQQELMSLKAALTEVKMERIRKESQFKIIENAQPNDPMPTSVKNGRINILEEKIEDLKQREAGLAQRFRKGWPEHAELQAQMSELERQLQDEKQRVMNVIQKDYLEALQRETMLNQTVEQQQAMAMQTQENSIQYNILKREVEINKQLLEGMLQRLKEATVSSSLSASNITILDRAEVPQMPFKPNKKMQVLYGLMIGLVLGIGMALAMENFQDTVQTPEEVNQLIQLPVLGVIPFLAKSETAGHTLPIKKSNGPRPASPMYTVTFDDARSAISEAFRVVRTSILLSHQSRSSRVILFTSPSLEDGKTTLAHNIAIALTQASRSVVLIDCDLRRPRIHKTFKLNNDIGMSTYLAGEIDLPAIIRETRIPKLYAIASGPIPLNPSELLISERMEMALDQLAKKFDYVIIDSPPLLMVTDAYILSSIVDGVVIVAKADKISKESLQRTKRNLSEMSAHILGVVLNKMNSRGARYGYGGYYQYNDQNNGNH